ncbi:MAG: hypothetical protein KUA37_07965 [Desulfomicrobium sp.]|nr:hypothetical protein [Pseudomonadota bacterium]MBV1711927.1 hypothetical protein [Desulfomicrobium sp.]MBU4571104.1 hypothetical protein [Pseudomonadota bacterium]MBU4593733.1 hypothetical protein [Pseudomonadota bacterium]MBV1719011.1 hypothetical protein [Desulfomicrobium sp.]
MMHSIRPRALLSGMLSGLAICAVTPFANSYLKTTPLAGGHFPLAAFFVFFASAVVLALVARISRRAPLLSGMELLTAWALMIVVSGISFTGLVRTFFINITAPAQFADNTNGWADSLLPLLPEALYPRDPAILEALYNGLPGKSGLSFMQALELIPWSFWLPVLGAWSVFILLTYVTLFCLANLFTAQWVVNERINFPLLQMPKLLAEAYDQQRLFSFLADPFLLCGLSIPVALHLLGGLSAHIPSIPALSTEILAGSYFPSTGFLSGFQKLKIYLYPAFIGFAFITTRQVSLSFWLFFVLAGLLAGVLQTSGLQIPDSALGTLFGPVISRPEETQSIGASLVFFGFMIWLAREYIFDVARQCLRPDPNFQEAGWISARASMLGTIFGLAALCAWSTFWGMGLGTAVLLYTCFFATMLVVAKLICQGGIPFASLNAAPSDAALSLFGSKPLGSIGLVLGMSLQKMLFVDVREALLPSLLHAGKITERMRARRLMALAIGTSLVLAVAVSFLSMLYLCYRYGIQELDMDWATRTTQTVYANSQRLLETAQTPDSWVIFFVLAGAAVMLILVMCYYLFPWWPIHPIGYLLAYSASMRVLWFSFLLGWAFNALCLRYGGTFLYRRVRLIFIGLIIGDFCMGAFWALVSLKTGISYLVLPS